MVPDQKIPVCHVLYLRQRRGNRIPLSETDYGNSRYFIRTADFDQWRWESGLFCVADVIIFAGDASSGDDIRLCARKYRQVDGRFAADRSDFTTVYRQVGSGLADHSDRGGAGDTVDQPVALD